MWVGRVPAPGGREPSQGARQPGAGTRRVGADPVHPRRGVRLYSRPMTTRLLDPIGASDSLAVVRPAVG